MNYFFLFLFLIIIIIFLIVITGNKSCDIKEKWQNYMRSPFNFIGTGANPIDFYRKDLYRFPYDYPYTFFKSYPVPCMQYHELL